MTVQEFILLQSTDSKNVIEQHINSKQPLHELALRIKNVAICSQLKYLSRAKNKLPSHYAARCIIEQRAFEQCSSEQTSRSKFEGLTGNLAIDLTCGLGVDSYVLSQQYTHVKSIEIDSLRAEIAQYNFKQLKIHNIEVLNCDCKSYLSSTSTLRADLLYIDPSRKDENSKRVFSLEDSSPNILSMIDLMRSIASQIIIKLSPMFDIDECFRLLGSDISVEVVTLDGECKEVLVKYGIDPKGSIINTILKGNIKQQFSYSHDTQCVGSHKGSITPQYLYVPNVSFIKTRTLNNYLSEQYQNIELNNEGYVLSPERLDDFAGQGFKIEDIEIYQPKKIKKILKHKDIKRATISHHKFPYSTSKILEDLSIKEGGEERLFFSIYNNKPTIFFVTLPN